MLINHTNSFINCAKGNVCVGAGGRKFTTFRNVRSFSSFSIRSNNPPQIVLVLSIPVSFFFHKRFFPGFTQFGHLPKLFPLFISEISTSTSLMSSRTLNIMNRSKAKLLRDSLLNQSEVPVFFIPPPIKYNVSGLVTLPPAILQQVDTRDVIYKILLKFVINVYCKEPIITKDDFAYRIKDFLDHSTLIPQSYYYMVAQHIITSVFVKHEFSPEILEKITQNAIDYTSFKSNKVTSQTIVEAVVFNQTLNDFIHTNKDKIKIIAQNPDNPLGDHVNFASKAYAIMKQPHPDFRGDFSTNNKVLFFDVKMKNDPIKTLSLTRGYLSLTANLKDKEKALLLKRFPGDIKTVYAHKNNMSNPEYPLIMSYHKLLVQNINNSTFNINQKSLNHQNIQNQIDADPNIKLIICSRIAQTNPDIYFDNLYKTIIENNQDIKTNAKELNLGELFSEGQKVDVYMWRDVVEDIISQLPDNIKKIAEDNYHKFKMLES